MHYLHYQVSCHPYSQICFTINIRAATAYNLLSDLLKAPPTEFTYAHKLYHGPNLEGKPYICLIKILRNKLSNMNPLQNSIYA